MSTQFDDLERQLVGLFGEEAAAIEQRAAEESGCDPVEAVQKVIDEQRVRVTTWPRISYAVLIGLAYGVLWPAITSLLRYPA